MLVSVHIADLGPNRSLRALLRPPDPDSVLGLGSAVTTVTAKLNARRPPPPGRIGMIASWEDDEALDRFMLEDPLGTRLGEGWHVRLEPVRVLGAWPAIPNLPTRELPHDPEEPMAALTLGRLRYRRLVPFLRASFPAESDAVGEPGLVAASGLARPPFVSTFSLWRSAAEMRNFVTRAGGGHAAAVRSDHEHSFHHESAFARFRPYASQGLWDGRDPLASLRRKPLAA